MSGKNKSGLFTGRMDDLFDQTVRVLWSPEPPQVDAETYHPAMDIYETDDRVVVELELPGVAREAIEVLVEGATVTIEGVKGDPGQVPSAGGKVTYQQLERKYGRFSREVRLPVACKTREGRAHYRNGILYLEFDKILDRRGQRKRIAVL
jgi:HSP20 family protein